MPSISDKEIEKLVEERVKEILDEEKQKMKKELRQEIRQENNTETEEKDSDSMLSRRQFMKTAGLGIGALSLSSLTSAWSILQPSSQGTSDIGADKVDGYDIQKNGTDGSKIINFKTG
jgi:hypothetical protein